jgi:enamine deaminase RidA (YjgF/YER057c/UK114 family)
VDFDERLDEYYIDLPEPLSPQGTAVNAVRTGKLLHIGGVPPLSEGRMIKGRVGVEVRTDMAGKAARAAAMNALAILRSELGGTLNKVKRIVQLQAMIACGTEFSEHLRVLDAASDLIVQIFGPSGKHSRIATGAISLPGNAVVQLSMIVEVK